MKLEGYFCTVGELDETDAVPIVGVPAIQLQMADGRVVTLTGLTREECREASRAGLFLKTVTLTLAVAA